MRQLGIDNTIKIDELLLFEKFVEEANQNGADLITLDTLSALADNPWEITRQYVRRISQLCRKNNVSLLLLQHTNKKGYYSGTSGLAQVVDTLLYIEDLGGNLRKLTVEKARFEKNREGCIFQLLSEGENSVRLEVCEDQNIPLKNDLSPLENKILDALGDNETMAFGILIDILGASNTTSIKGKLLSLEKKGYLEKFDGRRWDIIHNCWKRD